MAPAVIASPASSSVEATATSSLPAAAARANGAGLLAWTLAMYTLLGLSAGRIRFAGWRRRSTWWPSPLLRVRAA